MAKLSELSSALRSKNAGPFWVTIDLFFVTREYFDFAVDRLQTSQVADRLGLEPAVLKRFNLQDIIVIKFSFPRPVVQGHRLDRDMHGAQYAWLLADIELS